MALPIKKYHVNDKGEPGECSAQIKCKFGPPTQHYPTELDARLAFERRMAREQSFQIPEIGVIEKLPADAITTRSDGVLVGKIPPGRYFLADPFCIIGTYDQEGWNRWVQAVEDDMGWENDVLSPEEEKQPLVGASYDGHQIVAAKAFYGPGLHWSVAPPRRVTSDSGLLAAIPESVLKKLSIDPQVAASRKLGAMVDFTEETAITREANGNVHIGEYIIVNHNSIPEEAKQTLEKGDAEQATYGMEERRKKTYDSVVKSFQTRPLF